jgi:SAM-dependent methyltransferase
MLPGFQGKRVLDLGCGYGWHCSYAAQNGALSVVGVDISEKMLDKAHAEHSAPNITYVHMPMEDSDFEPGSFDVVLSSLAMHYIPSFEEIARKVYGFLAYGGDFVFSAEHPIFTSEGSQDWCYDASGKSLHFPVDRYFDEGLRNTNFLNEEIIKYHRTLTTYIQTLLGCGFIITDVQEPKPPEHLLKIYPSMAEELRRPMMLIISARKSEM